MDKEFLYKNTPLLLLTVALIFQYNLFVTPEKLEQTHREILSEVSQVYITKAEQVSFVAGEENEIEMNKLTEK